MTTHTCEGCANPINATYVFCPSCGAPLPAALGEVFAGVERIYVDLVGVKVEVEAHDRQSVFITRNGPNTAAARLIVMDQRGKELHLSLAAPSIPAPRTVGGISFGSGTTVHGDVFSGDKIAGDKVMGRAGVISAPKGLSVALGVPVGVAVIIAC